MLPLKNIVTFDLWRQRLTFRQNQIAHEGARNLSNNFAPFQNFDICDRSKVTGDPDGHTDRQTDRQTKRSHK